MSAPYAARTGAAAHRLAAYPRKLRMLHGVDLSRLGNGAATARSVIASMRTTMKSSTQDKLQGTAKGTAKRQSKAPARRAAR
jgi:hypothetical protein